MNIFILEQITNGEGGTIEGLFSSYDLAFKYYKKNCYEKDEPWTQLIGYHKNIKSCTCYMISEKELNPTK